MHNIPGVPLPEDRGILLKDVIECGIPLNTTVDGKAQCLRACCYKDGIRNMVANEVDRRTCVAVPIRQTSDGKSRALTASYGKYAASDSIKEINARTGVVESYVGQKGTVYTVSGGIITIKNKQYPIKLPDGDYIIRKLSIPECKRLQTVPDDYIMPCSATQNYKMLGNGWTVDVIAHILSHVPNIRNEKVVVLSMYDGMACGHIALNRLGANVVRYFAFEIDKDAIETATTNFPDIIQCGDAFRMRDIQFGQRAA